ncbi:unnamed protein product [Urochloa humidicola]
MASANGSKMIKLKSSDHHEFEVEEAVAMESQTIRRMIDDGCACIHLPDINSEVLMMVIEFCRKHVDHARLNLSNGTPSSSSVKELQIWEADFVKLDQAMLYHLVKVRKTVVAIELLAPKWDCNLFVLRCDFIYWF